MISSYLFLRDMIPVTQGKHRGENAREPATVPQEITGLLLAHGAGWRGDGKFQADIGEGIDHPDGPVMAGWDRYPRFSGRASRSIPDCSRTTETGSIASMAPSMSSMPWMLNVPLILYSLIAGSLTRMSMRL